MSRSLRMRGERRVRWRVIVLRRVAAYKLPNALRMTVGSEEANRLVVAALSEFLGTRN